MKKKNKDKTRKSITAVGAVVAAGLTPGIAAGTPATQPPSDEVKLTAADVVSINGDVYDFDDLFAMNQVVNRSIDQTVVVYGPPPAQKDKDKKKKKDKDQQIREQEIADSINQEKMMQAERERIEAMRRDSIERAMKAHELVYGPPPPRRIILDSEGLRSMAANNKSEATHIVSEILQDYVMQLSRQNYIPIEANIIRDLKLDAEQLEAFSQEIENNLGVQLTSDMMKQLGTLQRIANFIVVVASPVKNED